MSGEGFVTWSAVGGSVEGGGINDEEEPDLPGSWVEGGG